MLFHSKKGILALDIDGTLTAEAHALDPDVIKMLHSLADDQWLLIFITGRPFQWGFKTLQALTFPYALAVQNGALLLDMPSQAILNRNYLTKDILSPFENVCKREGTDFVIYSGLENLEQCYYRPNRLPQEILSYVLERTAYLGENWIPLDSFSALPVPDFSSVKCFAKQKEAFALSRRIEQELRLPAPPIKDPYNPDYYVVLATHPHATKGEILRQFIALSGSKGPVIAAGNDTNDASMMEVADCRIVMADAPESLLEVADIIAPPAVELGIIQGLHEAIKWCGSQNGNTRSNHG